LDRGVYGLSEWSVTPEAAEKDVRSLVLQKRELAPGLKADRNRQYAQNRLDTLDVEIEITQMNLKALRNQLSHPGNQLPDGLNPSIAMSALRQRLRKLLEQREDL